MGVTYPSLTAPSFSGDVATIDRFLKDGALIAKRVGTLAQQRYVSDLLLAQRFRTENGFVTIESPKALGTGEDPRVVAPLADYPLVTIGAGTATAVQLLKRGQDTKISDEAIARQRMSPVDIALTSMVEQNVSYIDSIALSATNTAISQSTNATGTFAASTGDVILLDIMRVVAKLRNLKMGYNPNLALMSELAYAEFAGKLAIAKFLPDSDVSGLLSGSGFINFQGITFAASPQITAKNVIVADTTRLGGMADEIIPGNGYSSTNVEGAPAGIQVKSIRLEENDGWRLRVRRVTVPVIVDAGAAWKLAGVEA